jgi:hypothetical protein
MNIHQFISDKIKEAFDECTSAMADELAVKYGMNLPIEIVVADMNMAENFLQEKWTEYSKAKAAEGMK